jgi:hypothetical protein
VRTHTGAVLGIDALVHTTGELVARVPAGRDLLAACLHASDLVKFAARRPAAGDHAAVHAAAVAFVDGLAEAPPDRGGSA